MPKCDHVTLQLSVFTYRVNYIPVQRPVIILILHIYLNKYPRLRVYSVCSATVCAVTHTSHNGYETLTVEPMPCSYFVFMDLPFNFTFLDLPVSRQLDC